jgi:hypothetical protein
LDCIVDPNVLGKHETKKEAEESEESVQHKNNIKGLVEVKVSDACCQMK